MSPRDNIAVARARLTKLAATAAQSFPLDVPSTGRHDEWGVTGPAFIARCTRLVQALLELPDEHESAAGVIARVLYEHVTVFAWIAIDPAANLPQWVRHDRVERLKIENDLARFGRPILSPAVKLAFEAERDAITDGWPGLAGMAEKADAHWSSRITEFSTTVYGLRGMFGVLYRPYSALVHGMPESLERIVGDGPKPGIARVGVEQDFEEYNAFTSAPFVYSFGLLVSQVANGFPTREAIHAAF